MSRRTGPGQARQSLVARERALLPLLRIWTVRHFRARYRRSALNVFWSLVNPLVLLLTYGIILTQAFGVSDPQAPYAATAWAGLAVWAFFAQAMLDGTGSIVDSSNVITKVYFPREVIPLAVVGAAGVDLVIGLALLEALAVVLGVGIPLTVVAVVPVVVVLVLWTLALTVFLAGVTVFVRDVPHAISLAMRAFFFITPIMYSVDSLPPTLARLANINPIGFCITSIREAALYGQWPRFGILAVHGVVGAVLCVGAIHYIRLAEPRMADVV